MSEKLKTDNYFKTYQWKEKKASMKVTKRNLWFIFCFVFATIVAEFFYLKKWKIDILCMPKGVCRKGKIKEGKQE